MSRPIPPTYKTRNWPAYNEALKRRGSLTIWFDPEMSWDAAPTGRRGRQQTYSDAAIQTCLSMKAVRHGAPADRAMKTPLVRVTMARSAMESFFSSLKTERMARKVYRIRNEARADVFDYIERFYNPRRRHSKLGYLSPVEFEARAMLA